MTYKLNNEVKKINSPIVLLLFNQELRFNNGIELAKKEFDKPYIIDTITAKDSVVFITVLEKENMPTTDWSKDKDISFF